MAFYCDWCGEPLPNSRGMVTMTIEGKFAESEGLAGWIKDERRHFHVGTEDDENSCLLQALHLIDSHETATETLERIPTATPQRIARMRRAHHKP